MTIKDLLEGLEVKEREGPLNISVSGIAYDSRSVDKGFLFVAVRGAVLDGHDFIKDALTKGAVAVITERPIAGLYESLPPFLMNSVSCVEVSDSRSALASVSARFYGEPSRRLSLVGITGTNGKTTTSFITRSILEAGGRKTGLIGTLRYITGRTVEAVRTTPESLDLQRYLKEMADNGMGYGVLEVSSHALELHRVDGCAFRVAAFTNFTQDHLDFHGSMEDYLSAKSRIFGYLAEDGYAVLNHDDPALREIEEGLGCNVITCGLLEGAAIRAGNIDDSAGISFDINTPRSAFRVTSRFSGRFNVYNILMAAAIAYALGVDDEAIKEGISAAEPVKGRFEKVDEGQPFNCIVDYAHTDDALRMLINEARNFTTGRIITVFGCGGDRDRSKRGLMGSAASELSDLVIVTSDNPRSEDPLSIIDDIMKGIKGKNYAVEPDRRAAINEAVSAAKAGDTVIVAGKGHEDYQEIKGVRHPFSDKEVLRDVLRKITGVK
ncbi:MAG: UDP-N-acetylmuramoyl-L-alanyl-D-glutamate--2,6-diaminopimelate ligase [Nitrospirae bacterium]|nr:UDP-N-acetylmuramoyl-L-alanyl-D-glutamate--2,6-diaminopimelate ligase [Nitrospirota bacterium]